METHTQVNIWEMSLFFFQKLEAQLCYTSTALSLSAFQQLFLVKAATSALNSTDAFHY